MPVDSFTFKLECPRCGGLLEHTGSVRHGADRSSAGAFCPACCVQWQVDVSMTLRHTMPAPSEQRLRDAAARAV